MKKCILITLLLLALLAVMNAETKKTEKAKPLVTFLELGSVNCVPCKMMQPIMKEIENIYGDKVNVVFYDITTARNKEIAKKYKIRVMPTQVFLDADGKEFFRHEGFYPRDEIVKMLDAKLGIKRDKK